MCKNLWDTLFLLISATFLDKSQLHRNRSTPTFIQNNCYYYSICCLYCEEKRILCPTSNRQIEVNGNNHHLSNNQIHPIHLNNPFHLNHFSSSIHLSTSNNHL